jgi:hypothetical protein
MRVLPILSQRGMQFPYAESAMQLLKEIKFPVFYSSAMSEAVKLHIFENALETHSAYEPTPKE